jgi:aryl-alcohol dehydrogenase-like predicted oxidoreductase
MNQLRENLDAFDVVLPKATLADIDILHLRFTNPAP